MANGNENENSRPERLSLGLGQVLSSGLQALASAAQKLDEKKGKPATFTNQEKSSLDTWINAVNSAMDEYQQRINNLENQVATLKAAVSQAQVAVRVPGPPAPPPPPAVRAPLKSPE